MNVVDHAIPVTIGETEMDPLATSGVGVGQTGHAWLSFEHVTPSSVQLDAYLQERFVPNDERWRKNHLIDRGAWNEAGRAGLVSADIPEEWGGGGGTFAHTAVVLEELARTGITSFGGGVQDIVSHYVLAYGSDARREGDEYVIDGSKTFITNGYHADLVCLAAKTDPNARGARAISLVMVATRDLKGFRVGRTLEKLGQHGQDTCELFFDGMRVPAANLRGPRTRSGRARPRARAGACPP